MSFKQHRHYLYNLTYIGILTCFLCLNGFNVFRFEPPVVEESLAIILSKLFLGKFVADRTHNFLYLGVLFTELENVQIRDGPWSLLVLDVNGEISFKERHGNKL